MARECELCHKRVEVGYQYAYRGLAKAKGGVGIKVTGKTKRKFRPNLQRVRATVDGAVRRVRVCTRCIKSGKVEKPRHRKAMELLTRAASSSSSSSSAASSSSSSSS